MPIQFIYDDEFKRNNPQAYLVVEDGNWKRGGGGVTVRADVYADKAAFEAGGKALFAFDKFVALDTGSLLNAVEHAIIADAFIASGSPQQVA